MSCGEQADEVQSEAPGAETEAGYAAAGSAGRVRAEWCQLSVVPGHMLGFELVCRETGSCTFKWRYWCIAMAVRAGLPQA